MTLIKSCADNYPCRLSATLNVGLVPMPVHWTQFIAQEVAKISVTEVPTPKR